MDYRSRIITYSELRKGFVVDNDKYGIATYEQEARRIAFLNNPSGADDNDIYMYLALDGDVPVGRTFYFRTRLLIGDKTIYAYSGSGFEVEESYRKEGVGGYLMGDVMQIKGRNPSLAAGISDDAIPLFRRLKNIIFEFPRMMLLTDSKPLLEKFGLKGFLLSLLSTCCNIVLHTYYGVTRWFYSTPKGYRIDRMTTVPSWVDDIVLNDGHKYAEVHDQKWLQWCLDHKFTTNPRDCQNFFAIFQGDIPVAFFFTKVRFREEVKGMHNVLIGSIVEWGVAKDCPLREIDLYRMALSHFTKDVSIIQAASNDTVTIRSLKRMGFVHHGDNRITFKERKNAYSDASNEALWRLRFGYADLILF